MNKDGSINTDDEKTYYVACGECLKTEFKHAGDIMWAGSEDGWPAGQSYETSARHYKTPFEALKALKACNGMPWWYRLKRGTAMVWRVEERHTHTRHRTLISKT